jgi:hypothetical protein
VLGVSNLPGRLPRGADPLIDAELAAGSYFVVLSAIAPGTNAGVLLGVHAGAECRARTECDSTAPTYCVNFACQAVAGDLVEVPGAGQSLGARDVPDGPPEGQMPGDMLLVPLEVDSGFLETDRVAEVQVGLNIRHTWRGDLRVRLRSPPDPDQKGATREVILVNRLADGADFRNDLVALVPETLDPVESLDAMNGAPVRGTWTLVVEDTLQGDVGMLLDWRLFVRAQ